MSKPLPESDVVMATVSGSMGGCTLWHDAIQEPTLEDMLELYIKPALLGSGYCNDLVDSIGFGPCVH